MLLENRMSLLRVCQFVGVGILLIPVLARGQTVVATLPVGANPTAIAVNSSTNKIYVADCIPPSGGIGGRGTPGTVTVIDGATNTTTTVPAGICPTAVAVNSVTNKIYVANFGFSSVTCGSCFDYGSITVIDGAANAGVTITDPNARFPRALAVDPATNKIYVANQGSLMTPTTNPGNVTVIDGATNAITTVADPKAFAPNSLDINSVTNKIYVANQGSLLHNGTNPGNVTVIDGETNATTTITDPHATTPGGGDSRGYGVAVNSTTNKVYVVNEYSHNITVIDGASNATTTVTDTNAFAPIAVTVDSLTNKIYVANMGNDAGTGDNVTVIDGVTNSTTTVTGANAKAPDAVAVNPTTGKIYVANASGNVTVIDGGSSAAPSDFAIKAASASLTAQGGQQVPDVITIASQNGSFESAIQLACTVSGSTPTPTCALSPNSVSLGGNSATSTLMVTVPAQTARLIPFGEGQVSSPLYAVFLPMPLALIGFGLASGKPKQRRRQLWFLCSLFLAFVALQAGCGGGGSNQLTPPPLNYTVTVTATSGAIQHTTQVSVTVP